MALPLSGTLSMSEISVELSYPATQILSLGQEDARQLADVPAGVISISDFYGKSNTITGGVLWGNGGNIPISFIQDFPTETIAVGPNSSSSLKLGAPFSNNTDTFIAGGAIGAPIPSTIFSNRVDKLSFSTSTISIGVGAIPTTVFCTGGYSGFNFGYAMGGIDRASDTNTFNAQKFNFSTYTASNTTAMPIPFSTRQGIGTLTDGGYVVAIAGAAQAYRATRMNTYTDTWDSTAQLPFPSGENSANTGGLNSPTIGYTMGGRKAPPPASGHVTSVSTTLKYEFVTTTISRASTGLNLSMHATLSSGTNGYGYGGIVSGGLITTNRVKLAYSTTTASSLSPLPAPFPTLNDGLNAASCSSQPTTVSF